ncbi:hypothetical protein niasHS_009463 [Heterodera schachtii]|uniref:Chromo domain-containing protein n=1 Tax=Heterodera schachtii TaxID=97005 RepID=A0ABD2J794_HETSC
MELEQSFEMPVYPDDDSLQSAVSPTKSLLTETVPFGPDVNEVPELGPNPHDQVVEVVEDAVSAAYSSDHEFEVERICGQKRVNGHQHYLVKWVGFAKDPKDWIPVGDLNCEEAINDYWQRYREGKEYRERKKEEKMKKTGQRKRKVAEMATAPGEKERKDEKKEDEKNGEKKELQQHLPVNAETEPQQGKLANAEVKDGAEITEEAKEEMGAAPGEMVEDKTEGREDVCKKGNSESADAGLVVEQLKKMLRDSGQMPTDNAPLPVPRWVRGSGAFKRRYKKLYEMINNK